MPFSKVSVARPVCYSKDPRWTFQEQTQTTRAAPLRVCTCWLQGGMGGGMVGGAPRQHETMGQRVQEHMPGHHNQQVSSRASVLCLQHRVLQHWKARLLHLQKSVAVQSIIYINIQYSNCCSL